jgi:hypothetical protein
VLSSEVRQRLNDSFASPDPTESLRQYALELAASGLRRQQIYDLFLEMYEELTEAGRELEEYQIGDVMDMITGTYAPFNLDIPK